MSRRVRLALAAILLLAAVLRVTGLGWGLRHRPDWDERVFVENAWEMRTAGDLDHRYYEYPGLFLYLLSLVLAGLHTGGPAPAAAYLAARGMVVAFALANVGLVYALGSRLCGPGLGLAAALYLAVSPVELDTSHMVRPDVVLCTAVLAALLWQRRLGSSIRADAWAGVAAGAACGVKFTGIFLAPSHLASRLLAPGRRLRGLAIAGLAATAVFVATSPYLFLHPRAARQLLGVQVGAHYAERQLGSHYLDHVAYYVGKAGESLGAVGAALLVAGAALALAPGRRRTWAPLLVHPLTTILVMSSADLRFARHLLPTLGPICLIAALPVGLLARRSPLAATLAVLASASLPLADSVRYAAGHAKPLTSDRALDWVEARARPGDLVLTDQPDLGLPRERVEVILAPGRPDWDQRVFAEVDFAVLGGPLPGRPPDARFQPETRWSGAPLAAWAVGPADRIAATPVSLQPEWLDASENRELLPKLLDGRAQSQWKTRGPQAPGAWFEVRLPAARRLSRIELDLGHWPGRHAGSLAVRGPAGEILAAPPGRGPAAEQRPERRGLAQVFLLDGRPLTSVRLEITAPGQRRWGFSELRLFVLAD